MSSNRARGASTCRRLMMLGVAAMSALTATVLGVSPVAAAPGGQQAAMAAGKCSATAAGRLGWGTPEHSDAFTDATSLQNWTIYDGVGHAGNGRRTPDAVSVSDGNLVIAADLAGNSGGLIPKWGGRTHGRWEICARSTVASSAWHAVALLWPDAENWPTGGEVDFMEIADPARQKVQYNLHYGAANNVETHTTRVDATAWHSWAVEWTPTRIAVFRDGIRWAVSTDTKRFPPGAMHLALQLDNFGGLAFPTGTMNVDWVAEYGL